MGGWWWSLIAVLALFSVILRHNLLFLMSLLLALLGGVSLLWTRYCLAGVSYRRRFGATRLFYGEETDLYVEMVNAKPLPLAWLHVEDEFPADVELLTGQLRYHYLPRRRRLVNLLSLRWYERVTRHYRVRGNQRGAWQFGPTELKSGDLFGFSERWEEVKQTQTLLVYPKMVPLTALGLPAHRPFGDFSAPRRMQEDPLRLRGARAYAPGDSFRHIHWKATARRRELQTKIFEPSATRPLALFLNINTFEYLQEGQDPILEELAITTAASMARFGWETGYQVGLYVNSVVQPGGQRIRLQPSNHPDQLTRICEALARMVSFGGWPIHRVVEMEAGSLPYGTTVVVVTAVVNDKLRQTLLDLQRREYGVSLITLGKAGLETTLPGVQAYYIGGREVWYGLESLELA